MRVLHLLASTDRRGAEVFATELARALEATGLRSDVVALAPGTTGGLEVEVLPALTAPKPLAELRRRAAAADVVLGHGSRGLVGGTAATLGSATPLVYRSIGDPTWWGASTLRRWRVGAQLRRADRVTALWTGAADAIVERYRVDPARVAVVPNAAAGFSTATDTDRLAARDALELPADAPVVAFVGALSPEKRPERAVEAVARSGAQLVVAGDGPRREAVAHAAARALPGRHRLLGPVADIAPIYAAADAVVLLSATEGQPGVAIEAGLCGLPVVATDVGGVSSVVVDGETGILVPVDADATAAGAAIDEALARRHALGGAARDRCRERFSLEVVAARFASVLAAAARDGASDA